MTFKQAFRRMPTCLMGGFDAFVHKTASDLGWLALHEVDLFDEGEDSDIRDRQQRAKVLAFARSCGVEAAFSVAD